MGCYRFVTGLGIGAASAVVPAYVAEISPPRIRGRLGTFWQLAIVFGQLIGLLAGLGWTAWAGSESEPIPWGGAAWRWMFVVVGVLAAAYVLVARALPRSPHDAVRLGHEDEARALLGRIGERSVEPAIAAMRENRKGESGFPNLRDLRGHTLELKRLVWVGILLAAFQQLVGINVVKTYSNALWQAVGLATGTAFTASIVTVLISIASTIVAIAIMDKVGRRTLLLSGAALMVVSLLALVVCFSTAQGSGSELVLERGPGIGALIAMNVFAIAFGVSWGPVMWLMLGELFDGNLRTSAVAVCTAVNWMTNWAVTQSFPSLAGVGLSFVYGLYTVFAALAFVFALKMLPETRGRTLR
jgi:SP family sugar:H+ symporter-like MFS transporter